jgi:poly(3-hydroxyalkanoate) synthetase
MRPTNTNTYQRDQWFVALCFFFLTPLSIVIASTGDIYSSEGDEVKVMPRNVKRGVITVGCVFTVLVLRLVLAGAPVDVNAGVSELSRFAATVPISAFKRLTQLGGGVIRGWHLLQLWPRTPVDSEALRQVLQISEDISLPRNRRLMTRFHEWYASTVDLPGTYYLQVVEWLYKENQLATGRFIALGRRIDLAALRIPIFLLAGCNDDIVAPEQVFAAEHLVGTSAGLIRKEIVPCGHLALFMGAATLTHTWPKIASWLMAPSTDRMDRTGLGCGTDN